MTTQAHVQYLNDLVRELQNDKLRLTADNARLRSALAKVQTRPSQPQRLSELLDDARPPVR